MSGLEHLLEKNKQWTERVLGEQPDFFAQLSGQQRPEYLWIGCADSRVPATEIVDLMPGEIFVHRNIANVVVHSDLNCLSVIQFAVEVLKVRHIIVCGHYGCGGVAAAYDNLRLGLIDNWLRHIQDIRDVHRDLLEAAGSEQAAKTLLCELNVIDQVRHVCETTIVQEAWDRGQPVRVHGWVYALHDGMIRDLGISVESTTELKARYAEILDRYRQNAGIAA